METKWLITGAFHEQNKPHYDAKYSGVEKESIPCNKEEKKDVINFQ